MKPYKFSETVHSFLLTEKQVLIVLSAIFDELDWADLQPIGGISWSERHQLEKSP